jgi:hypothetical protein
MGANEKEDLILTASLYIDNKGLKLHYRLI